MNINKLARVKTYLDPRDRLLENMYTASLPSSSVYLARLVRNLDLALTIAIT